MFGSFLHGCQRAYVIMNCPSLSTSTTSVDCHPGYSFDHRNFISCKCTCSSRKCQMSSGPRGPILPLKMWLNKCNNRFIWLFLSTGSGRHSDAAHEIRLIGCCVLLKVVPKNVPRSSSSQMLSVDWHRSKRCIYFFFFWQRNIVQSERTKTMGKYTGKTCRLLCMLLLTASFFLVEIIVGYITNSLALVGDSYHMLSDVVALLVGFASVRVSTYTRNF